MKKAAVLVLLLAVAAFALPAAAEERVMKVALGSMMSPQGTFKEYRSMVDYLGRKLGVKAELVQRESYAKTNQLLKESKVDLAFICSGPYVRAKKEFGVELLAVPVPSKTKYRSLIIVKKDAPFKTLKDLKGKTFAYTDPDSNTGCTVPMYMLAKLGEDPDSFFGKVVFTRSHDNSVEAVNKGLVDGAAVDSLIFTYMAAKGYPEAAGIKVIDESEAFGVPPVVVPRGIDPKLKAAARKALLGMNRDPEGKKILDGLMIEKFVVPSDSDYDGVRRVNDYLRKHRKVDIK